MLHLEQRFLHHKTLTEWKWCETEVLSINQTEPEEIHIFTMTMEASTRCINQEHNFTQLAFYQDLIIKSISNAKNIHLFTQNQFNIHKMALEETHMSKPQMEVSISQVWNVENIDKHLKPHLEAIIKSHFTWKKEIWVQLQYKRIPVLPAWSILNSKIVS